MISDDLITVAMILLLIVLPPLLIGYVAFKSEQERHQ